MLKSRNSGKILDALRIRRYDAGMGAVEKVREALKSTERPLQAIAEEIGVGRVFLSRFRHGEIGIGGELLERLAKSLGMRIVAVKQPKPKRRPK